MSFNKIIEILEKIKERNNKIKINELKKVEISEIKISNFFFFPKYYIH